MYEYINNKIEDIEETIGKRYQSCPLTTTHGTVLQNKGCFIKNKGGSVVKSLIKTGGSVVKSIKNKYGSVVKSIKNKGGSVVKFLINKGGSVVKSFIHKGCTN